MQTVYLLKGCYKSYIALKKLYNYPDLSTILIIVDEKQAEILLLDKRVNKFPFIINTLPTSIGLIPKIAKVLPLEMFMMLKKINNKKLNLPDSRVLKINTCNKNIGVSNDYLYNFKMPRVKKHNQATTNSRKIKYKKRPPLIKTEKQMDGSINIILNK